MDEADHGHIPVMRYPVLNWLPAGPGMYLDATFGGGGHSRAILEEHSRNVVIGLDCDPEAVARGEKLESEYSGRFRIISTNFGDWSDVPEGPYRGILFDFGVSSFHFDNAERGFSFRMDGPLDMRMNPEEGISASQFLNTAERGDLVKAVRDYGEERAWRRVVSAIENARGSEALERTGAFAELIAQAVGTNPRKPLRIHPATRTFQGVRIAINDELSSIEKALPQAFEQLEGQGRLIAITFHSLEDRIVKRFFRRLAGQPEHSRDSLPQQYRDIQGRILTRRPVEATEEEIRQNPRARSARLRVLEKEATT